jgi:hypothetical protein
MILISAGSILLDSTFKLFVQKWVLWDDIGVLSWDCRSIWTSLQSGHQVYNGSVKQNCEYWKIKDPGPGVWQLLVKGHWREMVFIIQTYTYDGKWGFYEICLQFCRKIALDKSLSYSLCILRVYAQYYFP